MHGQRNIGITDRTLFGQRIKGKTATILPTIF